MNSLTSDNEGSQEGAQEVASSKSERAASTDETGFDALESKLEELFGISLSEALTDSPLAERLREIKAVIKSKEKVKVLYGTKVYTGTFTKVIAKKSSKGVEDAYAYFSSESGIRSFFIRKILRIESTGEVLEDKTPFGRMEEADFGRQSDPNFGRLPEPSLPTIAPLGAGDAGQEDNEGTS